MKEKKMMAKEEDRKKGEGVVGEVLKSKRKLG
jgi:hypothetical protein